MKKKIPIVVTPQRAKDHYKMIKEKVAQAQQDIATHRMNKQMAESMPQASLSGHLAMIGHPSDFTSRAALAKEHGIHDYAGTRDQNRQLHGILMNVPPPTPQDKMRKQLLDSMK